MAKGLIWATAEDLARNRGRVLSLYRQILRSLNSPDLPLNLAARLSKKAEVRAIFMLAAEEQSLHNIEDLIDTAEGCELVCHIHNAVDMLLKAKSENRKGLEMPILISYLD
ncbi:unnamed protein product [Ilex paraguariensis]|uniref:LYR motif containing domain-containing protein n=1 Tax=Ilex paraguariensis TaxID=185542 RepID=A0ABC8UNS1_9AQUA